MDQEYRELASRYVMYLDGSSESYELIYLLLASAFLCEITDIPPLNHFSIMRYIST